MHSYILKEIYFASSHLISMEITLGFLVKMGTEVKNKSILMCYLKREKFFEGQCSCPFSGTSPSSGQGEHSPSSCLSKPRVGSPPSASKEEECLL